MPLRTLLFAPGNVPRRIEKAFQLSADAVILDLEDSVPLTEKAVARQLVAQTISSSNKRVCYVRVNALSTGLTIDDLDEVVSPFLHGIILTKVECPSDVEKVDWYLSHIERKKSISPGSIDLIPLIENAVGIHNAHAVAKATARVKRLCFGAVDYTADIGVKLTADATEIFYARTKLVNDSKAAGLEPPIDTVFTDIKDVEGLKKNTLSALQLGFQGKLVIHPSQVDLVNDVFTPSNEDVSYAKKIIAAFEEAKAKGRAAITLEDGKFIDYPVVDNAQRILDTVDKIKDERS